MCGVGCRIPLSLSLQKRKRNFTLDRVKDFDLVLLLVETMALVLFLLFVISGLLAVASHPSLLPKIYRSQGPERRDRKRFCVRQVPGDGGCLFHAIAAVLCFEQSGSHMDFDTAMKNVSSCLRQLSVDTLMREDLVLVMEGDENTTTSDLLHTVADHYNISVKKYCSNMRLFHTWGGGPEIVALSNALQRPIHVYELCLGGYFSKSFLLKVCARFGTPHFDDQPAIHILCADGRFPNLTPGNHKEVGDHFLALFPTNTRRKVSILRRKWFTQHDEPKMVSKATSENS